MQRKNCLVQLNSSDVPQPKQVPPALILKNWANLILPCRKHQGKCKCSKEGWHTQQERKLLTATCPSKCCFPVTYPQHWGIWHSQCWWSAGTFEQPTWTYHSPLALHGQKAINVRNMYISKTQTSDTEHSQLPKFSSKSFYSMTRTPFYSGYVIHQQEVFTNKPTNNTDTCTQEETHLKSNKNYSRSIGASIQPTTHTTQYWLTTRPRI